LEEVMTVAKLLVGVDGSPHSRRALRWAVEEARLRDAALEVAHGYVPPETLYAPYSHVEWQEVRRRLEKDARADAEQLVDDLIRDEGSPDVVIHPIVQATRQPARMLVALARDADLLVVGSRGRGGFSGLLLGSVSHQCVHHASCPVVVVPHQR
jgi:nucleotide-binding universal stress UspA family protein